MTEPRWLTFARTLIGTREVAGPANSPTIMGWAKALGTKALGMVYNADSVPWCGLFVAHVMRSSKLPVPPIPVRASAWDKWGIPVTKPYLGAVVRFQRPGGGHVAILTGVDGAGHYRCLGGNQSDAVNETWIEASRCVAIRWPAGEPAPTILAPLVRRKGVVSKNEA